MLSPTTMSEKVAPAIASVSATNRVRGIYPMSSQSSYPARHINAASPISYIDGRNSSTRQVPQPDSPWGDCLNLVIIIDYPAYTPQRDTMLKRSAPMHYTFISFYVFTPFIEEPCFTLSYQQLRIPD